MFGSHTDYLTDIAPPTPQTLNSYRYDPIPDLQAVAVPEGGGGQNVPRPQVDFHHRQVGQLVGAHNCALKCSPVSERHLNCKEDVRTRVD